MRKLNHLRLARTVRSVVSHITAVGTISVLTVCAGAVQRTGKTPLEWATVLVRELRPEDTSYQHKNDYVKWKGEAGSRKYESHTDCSGFLTALLEHSYELGVLRRTPAPSGCGEARFAFQAVNEKLGGRMNTAIKLTLIAVCFVPLATIGCGSNAPHGEATVGQSSSQASAVSSKRDPCALITKEEIEAALGAPISDVTSDGSDCTYHPAEGSLKGAMVTAEWEEAAAAMTGAKAGIKMVGLGEAVSGIGDEAVFMPPGVLYARKGDVFITINLYYADNPLDKTKALAEKAFARM